MVADSSSAHPNNFFDIEKNIPKGIDVFFMIH